ncbi:MAG TPA: cob(I)yrinic acid a,c-diamide adenosyltransferase [Nitrospiria bacterium]|nr:cob(I)yrinic acid a,c-diamide adenosyltransferase [Nitrospiria bacterium]
MAVRITRVYTRTGDRGTTGLVGGRRVAKDSPRVESYGAVDELNSWVGMTRALVNASPLAEEERLMVGGVLEEIQQRLFDLGAQLAAPPARPHAGRPGVSGGDVTGLERTMDRLLAGLKPLPSFLLPGGGALTATLHICRTVCRRAERRVVALSRRETVERNGVVYLNRLSDLLFVLARWTGHRLGEPELLWVNKPRRR